MYRNKGGLFKQSFLTAKSGLNFSCSWHIEKEWISWPRKIMKNSFHDLCSFTRTMFFFSCFTKMWLTTYVCLKCTTWFFAVNLFLFMCVCILPACMSVWECRVAWNWSHRQLGATLSSPGKAAHLRTPFSDTQSHGRLFCLFCWCCRWGASRGEGCSSSHWATSLASPKVIYGRKWDSCLNFSQLHYWFLKLFINFCVLTLFF